MCESRQFFIHGLLVVGAGEKEHYEILLQTHLSLHQKELSYPLVFSHDERGRPICPSSPDVKMSRSHKTDCVLNAFTRCGDLGIDLENVKAPVEHVAIARTFFSPEEASLFSQPLGPSLRNHFFLLWTGKEAIAKAHQLPLLEALKVPLPMPLMQNTLHSYEYQELSGALFFTYTDPYQIAVACPSPGWNPSKQFSFILETSYTQALTKTVFASN